MTTPRPATGSLVGYARVRSADQNLERQRHALEAAGCARVYEDTTSGARTERPGLDKALACLRPGDTLVVWRLDCVGRSLRHLIALVTRLEEHGIGFKSLQESIDTTISGGKLVCQIFRALAEFERNILRERTGAGLAAARARGRKGGRPRKLTPIEQELLYQLYDSREHTIAEICQMVGISRGTVYEYLRRRPEGWSPG